MSPIVARTVLMLLSALVILTGCGRTVDWNQEVPLQDGTVIVIERESEQGARDFFFAGMRMEISQTLTFVHPSTGDRIRWKLPTGLLPHLLDFDGNTPYYVLHAHTVADYNRWDCPDPPYMTFRYNGKEWVRVPFEQLPVRFTKPNLISMAKSYDEFIIDGLASIKSLEKYQRRIAKQYRTISRERINPIAMGCEDSVLIKQNRRSEIDHRM